MAYNLVIYSQNMHQSHQIRGINHKKINIIMKSEQEIKEYCKIHKLKFIKYYNNGFLASSKVDVKAGMKKVLGVGKFEHLDIRVIGQKEIIRHYLCYSDLDIVDNGIFYHNVD